MGKTHGLCRAVDQDGFVFDVLVQSRREATAAQRLRRNASVCPACVLQTTVFETALPCDNAASDQDILLYVQISDPESLRADGPPVECVGSHPRSPLQMSFTGRGASSGVGGRADRRSSRSSSVPTRICEWEPLNPGRRHRHADQL